jgi:hypothetical protein
MLMKLYSWISKSDSINHLLDNSQLTWLWKTAIIESPGDEYQGCQPIAYKEEGEQLLLPEFTPTPT